MFADLVEDYSRHQVPDQKVVSGIRIGIIMTGVGIALPAFVFSSEMGRALGFTDAISAFLLGGILITIIAGFTGSIGAITRLSTSMINRRTFGEKGAVLVNLVLGLTWVGWYAFMAAFFGQAVYAGLETMGVIALSKTVYTIIGSILTVLVTIFGFKALDKLSLAAVPLMIIFLVSIVYLAVVQTDWIMITSSSGNGDEKMSLGAAASLVVGTFIVGATMFPDLCRYARNPLQACIGSILAFAIGYVLILILVAIPAIATNEADLMTIITLLGMSALGFALLLFATWTTNSYNLYSASLAFAALLAVDKWKLVIGISIAGTFVAVFGAMDFFLQWISFLSITIPPIAGVYVTDFLFVRRNLSDSGRSAAISWPALGAWLAGGVIAHLTHTGKLSLTAIPAVDAILVAAFCYLLFITLIKKQGRSTTLPV